VNRSTIRPPQPARRQRGSPLRRAFAVGLVASVALHAVLALLPPVEVDLPRHLRPAERLTLVPPPEEPNPPDVEVPSPPEPVTAPEEPQVAASGEPVPSDTGRAFIPHDVPPRLVNPGEVQDYLRVFYPVALRVASVEGAVHLWLFVDDDGRATKLQVRESSGSPRFDELARTAAPLMKFRPALNQGEPVGVWVSLWVRFDLQEPSPADTNRRLVGEMSENGD
jgi:TonB family protein